MAKLLLVEDEKLIRDAYAVALISAGFEVDTAADGQEGYDKMAASGHDLVLLDVMLPKMDGLGILTKLKENKLLDKAGKIFLLTNIADDPAVQATKNAGAQEIISKVDAGPDVLVGKIRAALGLLATNAPEPQK